MTLHRLLLTGIIAVVWSVATVTVAVADPPGPTNYMSEVIEVDPETSGFTVEIVGGDSFVLLSVEAGVTVAVTGYQGEPYLRFLPDGTVEENQLAPSKYLNEDRYAASELPDRASAEAPPDWLVVSNDGSYAWHDHRTHWMNSVPPPGRAPGDQIAEGVIPLLVNGVEVDITVASVWQQPPSSLPIAVGFTIGLLLAFALLRRRESFLAQAVLGMALATTVVGVVAYMSVPTETAPPWSLWVFPVTSAILALLARIGAGRGGWIERQQRTLLLIATLELVGWGIAHWGWLWASILPTNLPYWSDRLVAATVLVGATGAAVAVLMAAAAPTRNLSGSR